MSKEILKATNNLLRAIAEFINKEIVSIEIKEGPLLKEARKLIAQGLRNLAKLVEDPSQEIKWIDIKK